jgi:hypothetical protein
MEIGHEKPDVYRTSIAYGREANHNTPSESIPIPIPTPTPMGTGSMALPTRCTLWIGTIYLQRPNISGMNSTSGLRTVGG